MHRSKKIRNRCVVDAGGPRIARRDSEIDLGLVIPTDGNLIIARRSFNLL